MKHTASLRRFGTHEADPANAVGLQPGHPALQGSGRTIFPSTVVGSLESPRFLVSGHNNPKLGKQVMKGPRSGWPIFHLTLEERATCPTSCEQWATCFGNAMPQARRHAVDDHFLPLLRGEVATLARANPKGALIRLRALGDFYSPEYVLAWAEMLAQWPQIAVFGYTARTVLDADPQSAKIARIIELMTDKMWDRFAIRTSSSLVDVADSRAIVVEADPEEPDTIVCPAQTGATEACATCGLCWAANARGKTIAFLKHGMTRQRGPRAEPASIFPTSEEVKKIDAPARPRPPRGSETVPAKIARQITEAAPGLFAKHPSGVPIKAVMAACGATYNQTTVALCRLHAEGRFAWIRSSSADKHKLLQPAGTAEPDQGLTVNQEKVLALVIDGAEGGVFTVDRPALRKASDLHMSVVDLCLDGLRRKGFIERVPYELGDKPVIKYRVVENKEAAAKYAPKYSDPIPERAPAAASAPVAERTSRLPREAPRSLQKPARAARKVVDRTLPPQPQPDPAKPLHIPVEFDEVWLAPEGPPGSLLALKAGDCHWPTNTPPVGHGELTTFCGKPALIDGSYCQKHQDRSAGRAR